MGPHEFTRTLSVQLTRDELLERGATLAAVNQDIEREELTQADVKASMKATLASLQAQRARLAAVVSRKAEPRDVVCLELKDFERGTYTIVRTDTGETIESRPLTEAEREQQLPLS
jgi:hypothetical protein